MENYLQHKVKTKVEKYVTIVFKAIFMAAIAILLALLVGYVTMLLWNWLMPLIFGLPALNYWQAVGLLLLAKIFFGFGHHSSKKRSGKSHSRFGSRKKHTSGNDFSRWKHYDKFWEEEGEDAYRAYMERKNKGAEQ